MSIVPIARVDAIISSVRVAPIVLVVSFARIVPSVS